MFYFNFSQIFSAFTIIKLTKVEHWVQACKRASQIHLTTFLAKQFPLCLLFLAHTDGQGKAF